MIQVMTLLLGPQALRRRWWIVGAFGWLPAESGRLFGYRLSFASLLFVLGATGAAIVHVWTEAALMPGEAKGPPPRAAITPESRSTATTGGRSRKGIFMPP